MTSQPYPEDCRIEKFEGMEQLESIRPLWEKWQHHPNADIDFYSIVARSRPSVVNPVALVLYRMDVPVAIAAGRLEKVSLPVSLGRLKVFSSPQPQITIVYGGLMGKWDGPEASAFIRYLRQWMRCDHINAAHLAAMRPDNPVFTAARRLVPFYLRGIALKNNPHWWSDLPDTIEEVQKKINSKHRSQFRNKERKLTQHCGGTLKAEIFKTPEEVPLFCAAAEKVARSTYLRGLGEGFYDNGEMRSRLDLAARKGWMRGHVLFANGTPCAFWLGTLYQNVFYLDYTGFDSDLKAFTPGQILFVKMIESLCNNDSVSGLDFGFGDAVYKQRYGDKSWLESDLYIFNNTPAMLLAALMGKSAAFLRAVAVITLKRFSLFTGIKKRWRLSAEKSARGNKNEDAGAE